MNLSKALKHHPAIEQTVIFGSTLHVSGKNASAMESVLDGENFAPIATSLEDVFIYLMQHSTDNFGEGNG